MQARATSDQERMASEVRCSVRTRTCWNRSARDCSAPVVGKCPGRRGRNLRMTNIAPLILIIAAGALYTRVWLPWGERASGNLVRVVPLSLFGRLRMHGPHVAALIVVAILSAVLGWVHPMVALAAILIAIGVIFVPVHYTLTSTGIRSGGTPFRRWTEFGGVARRPGGVRLQGVAGARPQTIWLSGGRDDDEFVLLLRQLVRGSYKGFMGPEAAQVGEPVAAAPGPGPIGIAGAGAD